MTQKMCPNCHWERLRDGSSCEKDECILGKNAGCGEKVGGMYLCGTVIWCGKCGRYGVPE